MARKHVQRGHADEWRQDKGQRPGSVNHPPGRDKIAAPHTDFEARPWKSDIGNSKRLYLGDNGKDSD